MIALDTNLLVYAHRPDLAPHVAARTCLDELMAGPRRWALPWPCVHEFIGVVTNPRAFRHATSRSIALATIRDLEQSGKVRFLGETAQHLGILSDLLERSEVGGPKVHDARIAAICLGHGVDELWTADRDFSYFPQLRTRNPLVRPA